MNFFDELKKLQLELESLEAEAVECDAKAEQAMKDAEDYQAKADSKRKEVGRINQMLTLVNGAVTEAVNEYKKEVEATFQESFKDAKAGAQCTPSQLATFGYRIGIDHGLPPSAEESEPDDSSMSAA